MAKSAALLRFQEHWQPASSLASQRQRPKFPPLFLPELKSILPDGIPRGCIAEVNGRRSSGRTSICLSILAEATRSGEVCSVIDLYDSFHPASAQDAGVCLDRLVWVRCRANANHALRTADLLLHAGGFGVVVLDLFDAPPRMLNRVPVSYWHRYRLAIENTQTTFLVCADTNQTKSCNSAALEVRAKGSQWTGQSPFLLLSGLDVRAVCHKAQSAGAQQVALPRSEVSIQTVA